MFDMVVHIDIAARGQQHRPQTNTT
jgi:hypothetical protein